MSDQDTTEASSEIRATLGRNLRLARESAGLSQSELSAQAGNYKSYVSVIEHGNWSIALENLARFAKALQIPPHALLDPHFQDYEQLKTRNAAPALDLREIVGRNIKQAREQAGLTQRGLSARSGVAQYYVCRIEQGTLNASLNNLTRLATALTLQLHELLDPNNQNDTRLTRPKSAKASKGRRTTA